MRLLFGVALLCSLGNSCGLAQAQTLDEKVDGYVLNQLEKQHIPGVALGVYRDGKSVRAKGYGMANVELQVGVKASTIFQSGSVGKQFAATAVMMLVEEGKIGLDDPIQKYYADAPEAWKNIKIRNLLSHTSGLSEYENEARTKPGRAVLYSPGPNGR
jgi:CubicO group peptidase (beta-lactamase class C family)